MTVKTRMQTFFKKMGWNFSNSQMCQRKENKFRIQRPVVHV